MHSRYLDPVTALEKHIPGCQECESNPFGMCTTGFRLLGEASRMREDTRQLEFEFILRPLRERPIVRMFLGIGAVHRV